MNIAPALGAATASLINFASTASTNATNRQMMRERNAAQTAANAAAWQRETAYNSPSAQLSRIRAAGLNPNLLYSSAPQNTANMVAPEIGAPSAIAPQLSDNAAVLAQQQPSMDAAVSKTLAESDSIKLQNEITSATKDDVIRLAGLNVQMSEASVAYTKAQKDAVAAQIANLNANTDLIDRQRLHVSWEENQRYREFMLNSKEVKARIQKIAAETGYTERELYELVRTFSVRNSILSQEEMKGIYENYGLQLDNQTKKWTLDLSHNFDEQMRRLQVLSAVSGIIVDCTTAAKNLR